MKLFTKPVAAVFAILGMIGTAHAGAKFSFGVTVDTTNRYANGNLGDARSSADVLQFIGCHTTARRASATYMVCEARDAWGVYGTCSSMDANLIAAIQGIGPSSSILFKWDAAGECTDIEVRNSSHYAPVTP
ncbi:hypothetical protein [Comamonas sp. JC664]|uniref:hypothetical protein n=1 Tax=Comamonas sp. JC664 TaxID=2801917 RepID=UPI00174E8488|nr:hypothetical protein [Comamonas sp. JC664]MBL0698073.1 hypothetical protein [Comamonas sp. JC664]GHG71177.1 hypothetical protein GCM10012319_16760 [Comamonas sp. KCTC 72670]